MLTRRGWATAVGSLALLLAGRVLGIFELFVLAAGAASLVVAALAVVRLRHPELAAERHLRPPRLHAGTESRVELSVHNRGRRRSPVVTLRDSFAGGRRRASFLVAPLPPGDREDATYGLRAERRGKFAIGPLEAHRGDPFGLVSTAHVVGPVAELTVYPAIHAVSPLGRTGGTHGASGAHVPAAAGPSGEEFYGLRAYQVGDDLRRVHWPSTARRDDLMIRQLELPRQGRATVLLDTRSSVHTEGSFEAAVSASASLVVASSRSGSLVRLVVSSGFDSGFGSGEAHLEALLERLAVVGPGGPPGIDGTVGSLYRSGGGSDLAVVTTARAPASDLERMARLGSRFDSLALVLLGSGGAGAPGPVGPSGPARLVPVPAGSSFADAWNRAAPASAVAP